MSKVFAVSNQKGGVGKTNTCINLAVGLVNQGKKVLLVDADPQGSMTVSLGYRNQDSLENSLATLMTSSIKNTDLKVGETLLHHVEGVDLIPGNIELAAMDVTLVNTMSREKVMKNVIDTVKDNYDYVIIDCMPSLGMMTINSLACADSVIIPVQAEFLSTTGTVQLLQTISSVKRNINPELNIDGILITMTDERTNLSKNIREQIHEVYGRNIKVYKDSIPRCVKASECTGVGESVFRYDPNGKATKAYADFSKEVNENGKQVKRNKNQQYR